MSASDQDPWNPTLYDRFKAERQQPFRDLVALIRPVPGMRIVDLGCGTGELTRRLHEQFAAADTVGVDRSTAMLARASDGPACRFEVGDIATFSTAQPVDLLFSNAALHWLPDHPALFARLTRCLAAGGQLAVQVPANFDHPSHTTAEVVAAEAPFRDALGGRGGRAAVLPPDVYAQLLHDLGFREQHVRLQVYAHELPEPAAVVEWVRGTLLTDYLGRLPASLHDAFVARYRERLLSQLRDTRPFLFPFKRILLWARR